MKSCQCLDKNRHRMPHKIQLYNWHYCHLSFTYRQNLALLQSLSMLGLLRSLSQPMDTVLWSRWALYPSDISCCLEILCHHLFFFNKPMAHAMSHPLVVDYIVCSAVLLVERICCPISLTPLCRASRGRVNVRLHSVTYVSHQTMSSSDGCLSGRSFKHPCAVPPLLCSFCHEKNTCQIDVALSAQIPEWRKHTEQGYSQRARWVKNSLCKNNWNLG